jgi:hypothetical protein
LLPGPALPTVRLAADPGTTSLDVELVGVRFVRAPREP